MKRVKMLMGLLVCLCFLATQAQAAPQEVVLDFDSLTSSGEIGTYGNEFGVDFTGQWYLGDEGSSATIYKRLTTNVSSTVGIDFVNDSLYHIDSFSYLSYDDVKYTATYWDSVYIFNGVLNGLDEDAVDLISYSVSNLYTYGLLKSINFSRDTASTTLYFDDVKLKAVPVPAAALLLGAGLLGIVGIRRRQTV